MWPVPPLPVSPQLSDAVRLFAERAAAAFPAFTLLPSNAQPAAEICRRLDGIPLAIELAAARVRALSVPQILERLTDRFGLLTTGGRVAPPRQRTLRAAIDWSHSLLDDSERILLRRLSVFAGWSLEMAEFVCPDASLPAGGLLDLLAALVDKSLVVREPDVIGQARYRMLDTIRAYAAEKLADAEETAFVRGRLREYVLTVSERSFAVGMAVRPGSWRERVDVFRRYDADASNVWLVLGQCLADGDPETGLRISTAIRPCMLVRGEYARGCEWIDAFLGLPGAESVPAGVRGAALTGRAQLTISVDPCAAEAPAREGLALSRAAGDAFWTAAALNVLSEICGHTGRADEAETLGREALALARESGDAWGEGWALAILAVVAGLHGAIPPAAELAAESIRVMREIDHYWGVARAQLVLASVARVRGDHADARERYMEALAYLRELDARPDIARCLSGLGRVALDLGETDTARWHLTESLRLARSTGSRIGVARGVEAFAAMAVRTGDTERAVLLAAAAASLRDIAGLPPLPPARIARYLSAAGAPASAGPASAGPAAGASASASAGPASAARSAAPVSPTDPNALWSRGRALTPEAAITLALTPSSAVPHPPVSPRPSPARPPGPASPGSAPSSRPRQIPDRSGTGREATPLTPREMEIAVLVASGRSNKAIAGELFISPATVARHIANIMHKLGFSTRTQIATWTLTRDN